MIEYLHRINGSLTISSEHRTWRPLAKQGWESGGGGNNGKVYEKVGRTF